MTYETLKGTEDFEPKFAIKINKVIDIIKKNYESFGFRPFDSPLIEYMDTLTMKYDDDAEIVDEIFKVKDRGERNLGLRYDLTTPLCRFVALNPHLKKPFRRYHIAKVFRDGPLKKGRLREFFQCDADIVGQSGVEVESELMDLFFKTYIELGVNAVIELNNNKILRGALLQCGANEKDLSSYILSIDKLKKIGVNGVVSEINEKKLNGEVGSEAIKILSKKNIADLKKVSTNVILLEGIEELDYLTKLITNLGVKFRLNFSLSRGLDIYTGNIWEAYDLDEKVTSSLGSGGRYDKVISEYMNSDEIIPAVGISFGLVPTIICLEELNKFENKEGLTNLLIVPLNSNCVEKSQELANKYRLEGLNVEVYYEFSMKKGFKYCDYLGVEKLIILGEKDIDLGKYTLKNLNTKEQVELDL